MTQIQLVAEQGDIRLDAFLAGQIHTHSRAFLHQLIVDGLVVVDGCKVKPSLRLKSGQHILVELPETVDLSIAAEAIPLTVRYEDEWLLVIDKAQGMVVHPAPGHSGGTLVNALLDYCQGNLSDLNGVRRPGIVHRIDKDTSGLLLVVKDNTIHQSIADKIRRHEIARTYQALVHGVVNTDQGTIEAPIGRDPRNRQRMAIVADGKPATSHFQVRERFAKATWLEISLETGRTHQIRVHCQYIGHPVLGDLLYAPGRRDFGLSGQALHASRLQFVHPVTGESLVVESPLPAHFLNTLEQLR
jgi:23S rRNA pseudouridine1911/1915/1917 synthase